VITGVSCPNFWANPEWEMRSKEMIPMLMASNIFALIFEFIFMAFP
jgi:hypothetical protein